MADLNNDIERYLRGEMSPAEMHAFEKRALDDPFLADALEGGGSIRLNEFHEDLSQLSDRLAARVSPVKVVPLWVKLSRVAAILLGVALCTFVAFQFVSDVSDATEIAHVQPPSVVADTTQLAAGEDAEDADIKAELSESTAHSQNTPSPTGQEKSNIRSLSKDPQIASRANVETDGATEEGVAQKAEADSRIAAQTYSQTPKGSISADSLRGFVVPGLVPEITTTEKVAQHLIRGYVTDADIGGGVAGVNVIIKGTNTGTVTNAEGYYEITTADKDTELVFSFIGYENKEVLISQPVLDVALNQDVSQLSEVVVVGYVHPNERDDKPTETFELAAPAGGRKAFKRYLEESIRYPEQAINNEVEGRVTIQFTIESSGRLTEFKVLKGIGYGCDEELIKVIKQGPRWSPSRRNTEAVKDRIKVRYRFLLPKKKN